MLNFAPESPEIIEIVLTGGSCAGKTSALQLLAQSLREQGYSVLTVSETVTMLATSGIPDLGEIARHDLDRACLFQAEVFGVQRSLREAHELDALAYHPHDCLQSVAQATEGLSLAQIRDSYAAVMHLVTAADGAEAAFSRLTNPARWDTPEEACHFDQQIYKAWQGHPHHVVVDNSTDFIGKMERLQRAVMDVIDNYGVGRPSAESNVVTLPVNPAETVVAATGASTRAVPQPG